MSNATYAENPLAAFVDPQTGVDAARPGDLVIIGMKTCPHCIGASLANDNVTRTANGTNVIWMDYNELTALSEEKLAKIGLSKQVYKEEDGSIPLDEHGQPYFDLTYADGTVIEGTPTATRTGKDGKISEMSASVPNGSLEQSDAFEKLSRGEALQYIQDEEKYWTYQGSKYLKQMEQALAEGANITGQTPGGAALDNTNAPAVAKEEVAGQTR